MTDIEKDIFFAEVSGLQKKDESKLKKIKRLTPKVLNNLMFQPPMNLLPPLRVRAALSWMTGRPMEQILPNTKLDSLLELSNLASTMTAVVRMYRKNAKSLGTADFSSTTVVQDLIDIVLARIGSDKKP